jgi:hypothetical protein
VSPVVLPVLCDLSRWAESSVTPCLRGQAQAGFGATPDRYSGSTNTAVPLALTISMLPPALIVS